MRIVVDIPEDMVGEIRSTVEHGGYDDPEEFLRRALNTQLELERGERESLPSFAEAVEGDATISEPEPDLKRPNRAEPNRNGERLREDLSLRDFDVSTIEPPSKERIAAGPLWGQYNRVFPMKFSARFLAIVLDRSNSRLTPYDEFRSDTAEIARMYGFDLAEADEEIGRPRGEKVSAGFPTGDKVDRSKERFMTHFVGQIDSSGGLTGSLPNLEFANIDPDKRAFGLTEAGLEFAKLENPLLDGNIAARASLSDEEREFYINHVSERVPAEFDAMCVAAEAIDEGINRPEPLSERIGELSDDWTQAQASTIRSGMIGRMVELGLVSRHRVGSRGIGYSLTQMGETKLL